MNPVIEERRFVKPAPGEKVVTADNVVQSGTAGPSPASLPAPSPVGTAARARDVTVVADSETIAGLGARNIGSAAMSGRVTSVAAVHEGDRLTVYVGAASGGVWKSNNGGTTFRPMFDKQDVQSIGAIAIDPEGSQDRLGRHRRSLDRATRFRSATASTSPTDGGETWTNMGLAESEHIAKILIDPTNTSTVYACVPGKAVQRQRRPRRVPHDRRRQDAGRRSSPARTPSTGCSLLTMDPSSPQDAVRGHVGLPPQRLDVPLRRRRTRTRRAGAGYSRAPMAARRGRRSTRRARRACPPSRGGASR